MEHNNITLPSKTRKISENEWHGVYEISNLYPGYGYTLGNVLRRVLLSSIKGAAVTKITFDSIPHEFTTIKGVREDILSVVLNIKKLRIRVDDGVSSVIGKCAKSGVGVITAGDIKFSAQAEVVDKDMHIAELTDTKASFGFEVQVDMGYGFLSQDDLKMSQKGMYKTVNTDAHFSPVRLVNYTVSDMRVGHRSDFNSLRVSIQTDGTITPSLAFRDAVRILVEQMNAIIDFQLDSPERLSGTLEAELKKKKVSIDSLNLSSSTKKGLIEHGVQSIIDLKEMGESKILEIPGVGDKAVQSIKSALAEHGVTLEK